MVAVAPSQIGSSPPVMVHEGGSAAVIAWLHVLVQPLLLVTVTEYVPANDKLIHCVVAPVFHRYELYPAAAQKSAG